MSHPHSLHEMQEGIGQTGRFGELFVVLGLLIAIGGAVLYGLGHAAALTDGTSPDGGNGDAVTVGWLFFFEGIGFLMFGVTVMLAGWTRHHDADDAH